MGGMRDEGRLSPHSPLSHWSAASSVFTSFPSLSSLFKSFWRRRVHARGNIEQGDRLDTGRRQVLAHVPAQGGTRGDGGEDREESVTCAAVSRASVELANA